MALATARDGVGGATVRVDGRLDAEAAEQVGELLDTLLREGVRSVTLDVSGVTYLSSAGVQALVQGHADFAALKGELRLDRPSAAVTDVLGDVPLAEQLARGDGGAALFRRRSISLADLSITGLWQVPGAEVAHGSYELSTLDPDATVTARIHGDGNWPTRRVMYGMRPVSAARIGERTFALGIGAIGRSLDETGARMGELVGASGVAAFLPTPETAAPDYLLAVQGQAAPVMLASGLVCEGDFRHLLRFGPGEGQAHVPLSEIAHTALEASGADTAGLVMMAESAGLAAAWLRRSPLAGEEQREFTVPAIRGWLGLSSELVYDNTAVLVTGLVSRRPPPGLLGHLRPVGDAGLLGHFHAAVFSYRPVPLRTVALRVLLTKFFTQQKLRAVVHLVHDDRGAAGIGESRFTRGLCWVSPVSDVELAAA